MHEPWSPVHASGALGPLMGVALAALAVAPIGHAEEPVPDPMWRSRWAFSMGVAAVPVGVWSRGAPDDCDECSDGYSYPWSGFGLDVGVLNTSHRGHADRWSFEFGPRVVLLLLPPGGSWFVEEEMATSVLGWSLAGGLVGGFRFRPQPPPIPGSGRGSFEWGVRAGVLVTTGSFGEELVATVEGWMGWSMPRRWNPSPPDAVTAPASRRTAVVLGPYVRGSAGTAFRNYPTSDLWFEAGIRFDVRREAQMPPAGT